MWILYLLLPFVFLPFGYNALIAYNKAVYYQPKELYLAVISITILGYLIFKFSKLKKYAFTTIHKLLLLFLFLLLIGMTYTNFIHDGLRVVMGFTFFYIAYLYGTTLKKHRTKFIYGLIIVGIVQAIIGILQYYEIYYKFIPVHMYLGRRKVMGTIGYVNLLSHFITMIFLVSTFLMFVEKNKKKKVILLIGNFLMFYVILLTQTRASWLGIIIVFLYLIIYLKKIILNKNKKIFTLFILGLLIEITFFSLTVPIDKRIQDTVEVPGQAISGRLQYWRETLELIKERPILGHGTGSFWQEEIRIRSRFGLREYEAHPTDFKASINGMDININYVTVAGHSHNEYLQIFSENGIFAFLLFLSILYLIISRNFKFKKEYPVKSTLFFIPILFIMVVNIFSFPLHITHNGMLVFLFLGLFDSFNIHFVKKLNSN